MTSPLLLMRAAIRAHCAGDGPLAGFLGGTASIYDEPPAGHDPVYALFGDASATDWSTSSDRGHEHKITIVVWGEGGSSASAVAAATRMAELLDDAPLVLVGHRLVGIAVTAIEVGRDDETGLPRAVIHLRAITEVSN